MWADLRIIHKDFNSELAWPFEVSKQAVEKWWYFRDCYNSGWLFSFLTHNLWKSFSWWEITRENKEWFNKDWDLLHKWAKEFQKTLKQAKEDLEKKKTYTLYDHYSKKESSLNRKKKKEYFQWLENLILFLELAIERQANISWWV